MRTTAKREQPRNIRVLGRLDLEDFSAVMREISAAVRRRDGDAQFEHAHPSKRKLGLGFLRHEYLPRKSDSGILYVSAEDPGWDSVANILARYGEWEFEDYQGETYSRTGG